ncbi:LysR family transcriptional regulator [Desulfolithobacter dissulfuricans]|uniref:LysR family transcriptional regulator n=2 Tax=Desulfolithobacter dissulfuricans TaxID=2795293 RepID=A0A915XIW5_9BACT|nr:LysR family transcriptional regulator [Desulfolithobacter dissulfuricans]
MGVTLRQLEIFLAVAETEHMTRASQKLSLSQSAASMAIAELEHQLNTPLFDRLGRRLVLNDRGRLLRPYATEALRVVKNAEMVMAKSGRKLVGELKVAASTTVGNYLLPYLLGAFAEKYPGVVVNLQVGNTEQVEAGILSGACDIGFTEGHTSHRNIETIPWLDDRLVVITAPRHPLSQKKTLTREDLESAKWIVREEGSGTEEILESNIFSQLKKFNVLLRLGHTEAIKKAVEAGLGVGCLSSLAVGREVEQGWLVQLPTPFLQLQRELLIVVHRGKDHTPLFKEFLAFCEHWKQGDVGGEKSGQPDAEEENF